MTDAAVRPPRFNHVAMSVPAALLDELLGFLRGLHDVWLPTCGAVAERVP